MSVYYIYAGTGHGAGCTVGHSPCPGKVRLLVLNDMDREPGTGGGKPGTCDDASGTTGYGKPSTGDGKPGTLGASGTTGYVWHWGR